MTSKASWEVDPETRQKLSQIQKKEGSLNDRCCDCGAPAPQWASPKFSTFICLNCAGQHRGLGVHVSFVRSVTMDAFKSAEIRRMELGGNKKWQDFYNEKTTTEAGFEESTIKERYDCEVGEEWKERLSADVEGRAFDEGAFRAQMEEVRRRKVQKDREAAAKDVDRVRSGSGSRGGSRTQSPAVGGRGPKGISAEQKEQNEAYFARMGDANASRPEGVAPSQGGKYAGFGSSMPEPALQGDAGLPSADEFQKDPLGALTKGFGWFGAAVSKQAKVVNDSYIQPAAKSVQSGELAAQARAAAMNAGQGIQTGAKGAADSINKFIEGQDEGASNAAGKRQVAPEKKDFWDSFGAPQESSKPSNIGTGVMKKTGGPGGTGQRNKEDGWGDDW